HSAERQCRRRERRRPTASQRRRGRTCHLGGRSLGTDAMDRNGLTLLVDAGNTRVKFGWLQSGNGSREPAPLALEHVAVDRLPEWLTGLPGPLFRAVGVSVASAALMQQVDSVLDASSRVSVEWLRSAPEAAGIINLYDEPAQLGP